MKRINLALSLIVAFGLGACGSADSPSRGAGGVTFDLAWQEAGPVLTIPDSQPFAFAPSRFYPQSLPVAVVSLRATITGLDMDQLEQTFSELYPAGGTIVVRRVPSGDNRNLVLDGLNSANAIIYQGSISGFTVVAEQTNDIGQIVMSPYGEGIVNAPSNLQVQAVSSSQLELSWTDNANNETGFYIERKTSAGSDYSLLGSVGRDVTGYQDQNLSCGTVYFYRVFAYGAVENSGYSNEMSAFLPCMETVINLAPPGATQSPAPVFGFSCNYASCSFECDLDGGGFSICFSPHGYTGLADGQHLFSVRAVDVSGDVDMTPATFSWIVDRVPPETRISSSPSSPSDSTVAFDLACDEANCTFECKMDSGAFTGCASPAVYKLENGTHAFSVLAIDQAGNRDETPATYSWLVIAQPPGPPGEEMAPEPIGSWQKTRSKTVPVGRGSHTTVWTGTEMIVWGGTSDGYNPLNDGGRYDPAADLWTPTSQGGDIPEPRMYHTAVWTGTEMIVWGGNDGEGGIGSGGRYNPATDSWTPTRTPAELPQGRQYATVIWTGTEAIAWGGDYDGSYLNSGCRYDPATDIWTPTSIDANTPSGRELHTAVWTGTEMIIWGGYNGSYFMDGGRYNPSSDSWTPTAIDANTPLGRYRHTAVWTGTEMIVWGGMYYDGGTYPYDFYLNDGSKYDPATDTWSIISTDAPSARVYHAAVWTGTEMIVWGGYYYDGMYYYYYSDGGRYNPSLDTWTATDPGAPLLRAYHTAVWDDLHGTMIVWGGYSTDTMGANPVYYNDGGRYDPSTDTWAAVTVDANTPSSKIQHTAVWTGAQMIVWGGEDSGGGLSNTGGIYDPSADAWTPTALDDYTPSPRYGHVMVWTGTQMIVWGGYDGWYVNTGAAYIPALDSWFTSGAGPFVETARYGHTAVWTGSEMIVWGGYDGDDYLDTGARYNPAGDSWTPTSVDGDVPPGRASHQAVWTGTEMIAWGGTDGSYLNTGGRYDPETDTWRATQAPQTPSARYLSTAVWTGTEMIVWGGNDGGGYINTGARYNPATDSWAPTESGVNAPTGRYQHTAVWTGTEMIVWGGFDNTYSLTNTGGRYNPAVNAWIPTGLSAEVPSARSNHTAVWDGADGQMIVWGGTYHFGFANTGGRYSPSADTWMPTDTGANVPAARNNHSAVWTGGRMIVWGGTYHFGVTNTGGSYNPSDDTWTPTALDAGTPSGRYFQTAVWTGTEMIVWGGYDGGWLDTGGRYDPASDAWTPTSTGANVPQGRQDASAVWTGTEMVVWGGQYHNGVSEMEMLGDGGRYNPDSNTWTPVSTGENSPSPRFQHAAVWTGSEMIVWGGHYHSGMGGNQIFNDGARYNPDTETWIPIGDSGVPCGRTDFTAVWNGTEMIAWGGYSENPKCYGYLNTGGRYNPWSDTWTPTGTGDNVPSPRGYHSAVWTGSEMIVWGGGESGEGYMFSNDGGRFDPATDTWMPTDIDDNTPSPRGFHGAVWDGSDGLMIVWGGYDYDAANTGGRYDPVDHSWTPTDTGANIPSGRQFHTAVWTGSEMIVWGGLGLDDYLSDGGRYDPATDSWMPFYSESAPNGRQNHTAVWTGTEMIIWGGNAGEGGILSSGGRYSPATDSWTPVTTESAPSGREYHTAVWTGNEMIVWGGDDGESDLDTGGLYDPVGDSWTPVTTENAPIGRAYHTAVWDDKDGEMIVWGGSYHFGLVNDGGRYSPATDSWMSIMIDDKTPTGRHSHTAVWTGHMMIVWGGYDGSYLNDGGKYDPAGDSWKPVTTKFAPSGRENHTAVWALGMMIIWGGTDGDLYYRDGGVYEPSGDYWVGTALHGAPRGRENHTAVWTGQEMIVWGGDVNYMMGDEYLDTGGRFSFKSGDPAGEAGELPYEEGGGGKVIVP
jgi:N-acetylneuraminic acid mutarotase